MSALATVLILGLITIAIVGSRVGPSDPRAVSDRFWATFSIAALEVEHYDSLETLTRGAEVVIRGSIDHLSPSRSFGGPTDAEPVQFATLTVHINEVLGGRLVTPAETLELELVVPGGPKAIDALRGSVPVEEAIIFLRNKGTEVASWGWPNERVVAERRFYRLVTGQATLRNFEGRAAAAVGAEEDFLLGLDGDPFADVLEAVKTAR